MSILSTMFITTALAGSLCAGILPENCEALQSVKACNIADILDSSSADCSKIIQELLNNCGKPSAPEGNIPETEAPDNSAPETGTPDNSTPENGTPDNNLPENGTPDNSLPENGTPETPETEVTPELNLAEQVIALVNEERTAVGLKPLTINESAMSAALVRAKEIRQRFSHTRPDGSSFSTALKEQGISYRGSGENIAYGQRSPEAVMKAWMNSSGHRANILNDKYTSIGVGCYEQNGTLYWTQLFLY